MNDIRAAALDGQQLIGEGTTIHVGRQTATTKEIVHDSNRKFIAHGTTTCLILR